MEYLKEFFNNPVRVTMDYPVETLIYFVIYLALYMIVRDQLYRYINNLHQILKDSSLIIYDTSKKVFSAGVSAFKGVNLEEVSVDVGDSTTIAKSRYAAALIFTLILLPINVWMLGEFLAAYGPLAKSVFENSELLYSIKGAHIVASAIIIVEFISGWGYYVSVKREQTFFKWFWLIFFGGLWFVETTTWYQLSHIVTTSEGTIFANPAQGTLWEGFMDGFLLLTGAGLTFAEFFIGYQMANYREKFDSLHIMSGLARVASYLQSFVYFIVALLVFVTSALFYFLSYVLIAIRWIIQFIMLLARFIFSKLGSKKEEE